MYIKQIQLQHKYIFGFFQYKLLQQLGNAYICYHIKPDERNEHVTTYSRFDPLKYSGVWKYCAVCLKLDYTLRYLESICSVSSQLRRQGLSLRSRP